MSRAYHRTSSGWTDERRARHSAAIRAWSPWKNSTGPRTAEGKSISRCNALKHGATSRPAKDFMRHFQAYRQFLRTCWQHRAGLAEKLANRQNELLNMKNYSPLKSSSSPLPTGEGCEGLGQKPLAGAG